MTAPALIERLAAAGLTVTADGDRLLIQPAAKLSDDLRSAVVAMKPELLALLGDAAKVTVRPAKVDGATTQRVDRKLERQRLRRAKRPRIDYYPSDEAMQALESLRRRTVGGNASSTIDRVLVSVGALVPEARA